MGITAISGPQGVYGVTTTSSGAVTEYNEERGPSWFDLGFGTMDPRPFYSYDPGNAPGSRIGVFYGGKAQIDYIPVALSSNLLATSSASVPVTGAAVTLYTSKSGAIQTTIIAPESGTAVSVLALDSTAAVLSFGQSGTVSAWNPAGGTGRSVIVTSPTCGIGSVTISGRDLYGYKVSETSSATSSDAGNIYYSFRKMYKYISSIIPTTVGGAAGTASTGIGIGTGDTYGFPLLLSYTGLGVYYNVVGTASAAEIDSTGAVTLGATATATSTTGDVRGTYASTTASNGTIRIQMSQDITPAMAFAVTSSDVNAYPLFGVTQYSSV